MFRVLASFKKLLNSKKIELHALNNKMVEDIVLWILKNEEWKQWTKVSNLKIFKNFCKFLNEKYGYNIDLKIIKPPKVKQGLLPENLITLEELKKLFDTAETLQQKTLLALLYESGARIGEILTLKVGNVQFNDYGARIKVSGKQERELFR